jgi:putative heme-binding domain-containing protein
VVDPGKVISDRYNFEIITRNDGTEMTGKVIEKTAGKWVVATNPFDLNQVVEISASDISGSKPSPVSPMPPGLVNRLNPQELKDLLAYLLGK